MTKIMAFTVILAGTVSAAITAGLARAASPLTEFTSVNIDLPSDDRMFPDGANADAINNNCLACHSAGMVLTQPPQPPKVWKAEVEKMRSIYKAPIAEEDVQAIVDYLNRVKGAD